MNLKVLKLFFVICFLANAQLNSTKNACSVYCQNCNTSVTTYPFYTCRSITNNGCPTDFITNDDCDGTSCSNCTADPDIFTLGDDLGIDLSSLPVASCGFFGSVGD